MATESSVAAPGDGGVERGAAGDVPRVRDALVGWRGSAFGWTVRATTAALRKKGIGPASWTPHWFRHSHATALLLAGTPEWVVSRATPTCEAASNACEPRPTPARG